MIKLKSLLKESSPGFENRQVGDSLPTLDSVRAAYQAKKSLEEAESFTATSKKSGETVVFKSKDARDSAIKAGTHDKKDDKDSNDSNSKKDTPKVNIFDKPKNKEDEPKSEPFNLTDDFIDSIKGQYKNVSSQTPEQEKALEKSLINKLDKEQLKKLANSDVNVVSDMAAKKLKGDEPKSEPSKPRPGNPKVNKEVRKITQDLGFTPQKLGKEEYEKKMSQAAVEALTDANFHSEARKLISILEDNPEFAKNPNKDPNKPKDMFSPEYDEWRKNSVFSSEFYDSDDDIDKVAHMASNEARWDGETAADAIAFDLKMNGSHKLAAKIQSIFNEKNESTTSIADMIPESVVINEGTRSQVGVIGRNGKIISAYVHYDGYPRNMKPGLKHHMKSEKDVLKLIKMGGARGIFDDKEIEYYKSGQPMKGDSKDIKSYINDAGVEGGAEYVYLYNMKDKKWYFADVYGKKELKKLF